MTASVRPVYCKQCGRRLCDTDGRGRIEIVCRRCAAFNIVEPRPLPLGAPRVTLNVK